MISLIWVNQRLRISNLRQYVPVSLTIDLPKTIHSLRYRKDKVVSCFFFEFPLISYCVGFANPSFRRGLPNSFPGVSLWLHHSSEHLLLGQSSARSDWSTDGLIQQHKYTRRRAANTGKKDTQHNNLFGSPPQVIARSNNAPTPPPPSFQNMHIPNILHILLLSTISRRAGYTGIEDDIMANVDFCPGNLPGPSYGHSDYKAGLQVMRSFNIVESILISVAFANRRPYFLIFQCMARY